MKLGSRTKALLAGTLLRHLTWRLPAPPTSVIYDALERELAGHDFVCGELSIADFVLFPHLTAVRSLNVAFEPARCPALHDWLKRMRSLDTCARDLLRTKQYMASVDISDIERKKIFWRGDRLEWLLARGFHGWLVAGIYLPWLRRERGLGDGAGIAALHWLSATDFGSRWDGVHRNSQAAADLVSCDVVCRQPEAVR